jgi:hypothetical protein
MTGRNLRRCLALVAALCLCGGSLTPASVPGSDPPKKSSAAGQQATAPSAAPAPTARPGPEKNDGPSRKAEAGSSDAASVVDVVKRIRTIMEQDAARSPAKAAGEKRPVARAPAAQSPSRGGSKDKPTPKGVTLVWGPELSPRKAARRPGVRLIWERGTG